jgi:cell division protein FtsW (lipid II flippase)
VSGSLSSLTATFPDTAETIARREGRFFVLAFLFLALTGAALALAPAARLDSWQLDTSRLAPLTVLPIWMGSAWAVRRTVNRTKPNRDPILLPIAYLLTGWGTMEIWRLLPAFGARQTAWFLVGTVVLVEVFRRPPDLGWLRRYRYLWMSAAILLTGLTLLFGTNPSGGEPHLWLGCCGLYFQPSELLRLLLIVYLASFLGERLAWKSQVTLGRAELAPIWVIGGLSILLVVAQRDLGTGTLFVGMIAVLVYAAFGRWKALLAAGVAAGAGGALGWLYIGVVRFRIEAWLNPWADPSGNAYQVVQSLIAIASGGLLGSGPGFGSPGFVPAAHTDFIFAAIAEEWGMMGALAMIGLIAILVSRGLRAAKHANDPFSVILAAGVSIGIGLQSLLIIGGVVRLVPLTGVTLPFVSYGGSSLLTSLLGLAFLVHISGGRTPQGQYASAFLNIQAGFSIGWVALAATLGWWTLYRAPVLVTRFDNPRRALAERYSPRGSIFDNTGQPLVETVGTAGEFQRIYADPSVAPVVGYDSSVYGQSGVELSMDSYLRGLTGYAAVDVLWHDLLRGTPPPGFDVRLSIDGRLQHEAMAALSGRPGAVVMLNAESGSVLALASAPSFDPNRLEQTWVGLTQNESSPLLNRATQGEYQPGVALAPFAFAWALQTGTIEPDDLVRGAGQPVAIDGQSLACIDSDVGRIGSNASYEAALRAGCAMPFYQLGRALGADELRVMAETFGFGSPPAIRTETTAGNLALAGSQPSAGLEAIGQGGLTASPLQMAQAFSAFLSGGDLPALQLVEAVRPPGGSWRPIAPLSPGSPAVSSSTADSVNRALTSADGHRIEFAGLAVSGSGESHIVWYEGASTLSGQPVLVVVVLENADVGEARDLGRALLPSSEVSQP